MSNEATAALVSDEQLLEIVRRQRWLGARAAEATELSILDQAELRAEPPRLVDLLVEVRFGNGAHLVYQLLLGLNAASPDEGCEAVGAEFSDALVDAGALGELIELMRSSATVSSGEGTIEFSSVRGGPRSGVRTVRQLGLEQSNSSVVVDDELIVKLYRRLEAGVNPELELLRFLGGHGFDNVPGLLGAWSYSGPALSATLGVAQRYLRDAVDGWSLAVDELADRPQAFLERVGRLGTVVGEMHCVLASDADDPAFAPEEASQETIALIAATVDDEIEQVFEHLPDDASVAPIAGCGDAVRGLLQSLRTFGSVGRLIRAHGDLHLGQLLLWRDDWFVVDFEGEPARTMPERRAKRSPLRDVAGMLRSFSYAATVSGHGSDETEERARSLFLESYLGAVQPAAILPPSDQIERLIAIFELEKAIYELAYELAYRPDWVYVPVAGIRHLLEQGSA